MTVIPQGIRAIYERVPGIIEDAEMVRPGRFRLLVDRLLEHLTALDLQKVKELEREIQQWHRDSEPSRRLEAIPGIGPITASALVASAGAARNFKNARQLAAWIGLVPREHSSGGKSRLLGIRKRGEVYLRTLLIHGGRAVVQHAATHADQANHWLTTLINRRHSNVSAVAVANKNPRVAWTFLASGREDERSTGVATTGS